MKKILLLLSLFSVSHLYPAGQALKVQTIKTDITAELPFTAQTTILQIKQALEQSEGVPVAEQVLVKKEGWALKLPVQKIDGKWSACSPLSQVKTVLDNNQTCGDYDLQHNVILQLFLRLPQPATQNEERKE